MGNCENAKKEAMKEETKLFIFEREKENYRGFSHLVFFFSRFSQKIKRNFDQGRESPKNRREKKKCFGDSFVSFAKYFW